MFKLLCNAGFRYLCGAIKGVRYNKDGSFSGVLDPKWE